MAFDATLLPASRATATRRRVLAFIALGSVLASLGTVALTYRAMRATQAQTAHERLTAATTTYGTRILDRLAAADVLLSELTGVDGVDFSREEAAETFSTVVTFDSSYRPRKVLGRADDVEDIAAAIRRRTDGNAGIVVIDRGSRRVPLLIHRLYDDSIIAGALHPTHIWGESMQLPSDTSLCVRTGSEWLNCSNETRHAGTSGPGNREVTPAAESLTSTAPVTVSRPLPLRARFGVADWEVVAAQSATTTVSALPAVSEVIPPAVGLAALIGMLLSLAHLTRAHRPFADLVAALQRLGAGDFTIRISESVLREYGELGHAVNRTAAAAERQSRLLKALAEVDHHILVSESLEPTVRSVLINVRRLMDCDAAIILPMGAEQDGTADLFVLSGGDTLDQQHRAVRRRELGTLLNSAAPDAPVHLDWHRASTLVPALKGPYAGVSLLPVQDHTQPVGLLLLLESQAGPQRLQLGIAQCLASRLSIAATNARREWDLLRHAYFDAVTELPNRRLLRDRMQQALASVGDRAPRLAVLHIGLDRFKSINDSLGHAAGDQVLRLAADRIRAMANDAHTVARLEGDEFAVLLPVDDAGQAREAAERIASCFKRSFRAASVDYCLSVSTGIALAPGDGVTAEHLLHNARTAMQRAKRQAAGSFTFFEETMNVQASRRAYLEHELRAAYKNRQLEVHFQPKLDLRRGAVVGAEALLHWRHPSDGTVPPDQFIPIAEDSGLIVSIGYWVVESACQRLVEWRRLGLDIRSVAVNFSLRQLRDPDFVPEVVRLLTEAQLPPGSLELEVTESTLAERPQELAIILQELRDHGVRIAIDDFGTGYSSLAMLLQLPIDVLKIDRAFIRDITAGGHAEAITNAIIAMGHALGKELVAEGIETPQQAQLLEHRGCQMGQGFCYSKPLPSREFVEFCRQSSTTGGAPSRAEAV